MRRMTAGIPPASHATELKASILNLVAFKKIFFAAALAGLLAGLLLTGVQKIQVSPLILKAETYEVAEAMAASHGAHEHEHAHEHKHEHEHAWKPENGVERSVFTVLANISMAVGFGLLLGAAISLRGGVAGWRAGLLWGLAGYAVFFAAPSIGLPPDVPGTEAAPLADRQLWWWLTVAATAGGIALLIFARDWKMKLLGVLLIGLPHWIGAPQPELRHSAAPEELTHAFLYATAVANGVLWLALGGLTGLFYKKFS